MRFHITAASVARDRQTGNPHSDLTLINMRKVTQGRENGKREFEKLVEKFEDMKVSLWETDGYMPPEPELEGGPDDEGFEGLADVVGRGEAEEVTKTAEPATPPRPPKRTKPRNEVKGPTSGMTAFGEVRPRLKKRNDAFDTIFDTARAKVRRGEKNAGKATF